HVDVYQLHGPPATPDDVFAELDDLRRAGKVRRFGIGAESLEVARAWFDAAPTGLDVIQQPYVITGPGAAPMFPAARERGLDLWVRGVLGGGVLAAAMIDRSQIARHPKHDLVAQLSDIASQAAIGLDELAVRWVRATSGITAMILGTSSPL